MVIINSAVEPGAYMFSNGSIFIHSDIEKHEILWGLFHGEECFYSYIWRQKDLTFDEKLTASCRRANSVVREFIYPDPLDIVSSAYRNIDFDNQLNRTKK